tara:strand:- start:2186 stop:3085 length:900 start_codon:yes stop_codon:yes gene_type:complete
MHLVIDLANQIILPQLRNENLDSWITRIGKRIKFVLTMSNRWKLQPIFVCDAGYTTEEVQQKWKCRREKELERSVRRIPYCADMMVCELILKRKLNLVFDKRFNADDIVATIANMHPQSIILSRDMDYFRYDNEILKNRVFYIGNERKITQLHIKEPKREPLNTIRMYFPVFAYNNTDFIKFVTSGLYMRGTAYPLGERGVEQSLHLATRKYRQLLYTDNVREIFPIWNEKVTWEDSEIEPIKGDFPENSKILTNDIIYSIGGCIDEQHRMTAITMACELFAAKNKTSLLHELSKYSNT